jgi:hypothetical protein
MKIILGWDQILIELGDELFVFDGVGVNVILRVFEIEHSLKINMKFILIHYESSYLREYFFTQK